MKQAEYVSLKKNVVREKKQAVPYVKVAITLCKKESNTKMFCNI